MRVEPLAQITKHDWAQLIDGEENPWGTQGEALEWGVKERNLGLRDADERLVAVAGAVVASLQVADAERFAVVGIGSVFITRARRGTGLLARMLVPLLDLAAQMGPEHAMLFCREELVRVYSGYGFTTIADPVWVDQPAGPVRMPLAAMWRALREPAIWPPGRVDVQGLPF